MDDKSVQKKRLKDLNRIASRRLNRNLFQADRQEQLLRDAREWAVATLETLISEIQDVPALKNRVVKATWDEFVPKHPFRSDFELSYRDLAEALWEEGSPSIEDVAIALVAERARPLVAGSTMTSATIESDDSGELYDPKWAILCTDMGALPKLREKFERLAEHAAGFEFEMKFATRPQAVDAWLDAIHTASSARNKWKVSEMIVASEEHCAELRLRALRAGKSAKADILEEVKRQFRSLEEKNPDNDLFAILRTDAASSAAISVAGTNNAPTSTEIGDTLAQVQRVMDGVTASASASVLQGVASATANSALDELARVASDIPMTSAALGNFDAARLAAAASTAQLAQVNIVAFRPTAPPPSHKVPSLKSGIATKPDATTPTAVSVDPERGRIESQKGDATPRMPRRTPDVKKSRERIQYVDQVATELVTLKQSITVRSTQRSLRTAHPRFALWKILSNEEIKEIIEGKSFKPRTYAENLALRKFGVTSRETFKKDRQKIKRSEPNG